MTTQYQEAGEQLAADGLRVAQVDADAYETYKTRYGVEEYPTLRLMCGGMAPEFTGDEMNTTQIVDWVRDTALAEPPVLVNAALQVAEAEARVAVIGFFADTDSHEAEAFRRATACMTTVTRLMSTDPKAADHVRRLWVPWRRCCCCRSPSCTPVHSRPLTRPLPPVRVVHDGCV